MKSYQVLGYTADADTYCPECANKLYGPFKPAEFDGADYDEEGHEDHEGNPIHPIFADSEWDYLPVCGECGGEIEGVIVLDNQPGEPCKDCGEPCGVNGYGDTVCVNPRCVLFGG